MWGRVGECASEDAASKRSSRPSATLIILILGDFCFFDAGQIKEAVSRHTLEAAGCFQCSSWGLGEEWLDASRTRFPLLFEK